MLLRRIGEVIAFTSTLSAVVAAPPGFPTSGNGLWFTTPGRSSAWSNDWIPIGNGYLAAMLQGQTTQEVAQLNIESLWSGGPFQDPNYNGGNQDASQRESLAQSMQSYRQAIFDSPNGKIDNVSALATDVGAYGSYAGAGYLLSTLAVTGDVSDFTRWLDMDDGVQRTRWTQGNTTFFRETFCSYPLKACVQHITTSDSSALPALTFAYSVAAESGIPTPTVSCFDNATLKITGTVSNPGMAFEILARVSASSGATVACAPASTNNATLTVTKASAASLTWVGGTDYDMDAGDAAHNFSFKGADPHDALLKLINAATSATYANVLKAHVADYAGLMTRFQIDIGQTPDLNTPTDELKNAYRTDEGNPYLEWLLFNFGRYLLAGSSRGLLPANLQGKWGKDLRNAWGSDYHANINLQMNYWFAEMTDMDVVTSLFDYMEKTWVPRGIQTAAILYNISEGWVTHNEMNTFGHTGFKGGGNSAYHSDYPEANAWMMFHVWDHFDFTQDLAWFKAQGWPLLKGTAQFHLQKLVPDKRFNDSTLIVLPCNSPEQTPITMACTHSQHVIWQLFNAIEKGFPFSGDTDTAFLNEVLTKRAQMDKGFRIGSWGQLQEWKVELDPPASTHRHLSHLTGLYPGYSITRYNASIQGQGTTKTYTYEEVLTAAETSLIHRGNGTGSDADSGWEKVWRAACWAQLGNATQFYHILSYSLERNFAPNLFSLYSPGPGGIFQIDANFGFPAALLNGLIQAPDQPSLSDVFLVSLIPALPSAWPKGSIRGARIRGGLAVNFAWDNGKVTSLTMAADATAQRRMVRFTQAGKEIKTVKAEPGVQVKIL